MSLVEKELYNTLVNVIKSSSTTVIHNVDDSQIISRYGKLTNKKGEMLVKLETPSKEIILLNNYLDVIEITSIIHLISTEDSDRSTRKYEETNHKEIESLSKFIIDTNTSLRYV